MAEKTVIEHLESIESKLDPNEIQSLDEKLGCSFEDVIKNSTVYFEAKDLIRYKRDKKNTLIKNFIFGLILLLPLIVYFVLHFAFNKFTDSVLNYLPVIVTMVYFAFCILRLNLRKPKRPAISFWNCENYKFYIFDNELRRDETKAPFGILVIVFKILTIIFSVVAFAVAFKDIDKAIENFDLFFRVGSFIVCEICVLSVDYSFRTYDNDLLFETENFVIRKSGAEYTREDK